MPDPHDSDAVTALALGGSAHRDAFAVTDELAVHGAGCVCPRCAGRLTGLLTELAQAIDRVDQGVR